MQMPLEEDKPLQRQQQRSRDIQSCLTKVLSQKNKCRDFSNVFSKHKHLHEPLFSRRVALIVGGTLAIVDVYLKLAGSQLRLVNKRQDCKLMRRVVRA